MALTDEQEAALRAELVSLSGELATIARVNGLIQRAHARHEAEERQKDDELAALRARLAESEGREQRLRVTAQLALDVLEAAWDELTGQETISNAHWAIHELTDILGAAAQPASAERARPDAGGEG